MNDGGCNHKAKFVCQKPFGGRREHGDAFTDDLCEKARSVALKAWAMARTCREAKRPRLWWH